MIGCSIGVKVVPVAAYLWQKGNVIDSCEKKALTAGEKMLWS